MTGALFAAFVLLTWGCYRVLSREAWWCQDRRGRALLLAGAVGLILIIVGGVM